MAIRRRSIATAIVALVLVGVAGAVWWQPARQQQQPRFGRGGGDDGPVPVVAALAKRSDVPVYLDGVGTIRALNTVTVRSQVDGKLLSVNYTEGQQVERGYVLAKIDPTTYQAAYDQAVAKKALDEATLANARLDLERYTRLVASNSIARQQLDTQKMLVAQQEAQVNLDQAQIDNAKAILDYTNVVAPISGRTGIRQVDQGNTVHASDSTGIVVITQLQPISILFTLPQQQLGDVNRAFASGALQVDVFGPDNKTVIEQGELKVVDNQVDPATGTIKLKAEFANRDLQLWPGAFVNVRLSVQTLKDAVVLPQNAIITAPRGKIVYVVDSSNKASARPVEVTYPFGEEAVVTGVRPGERVVVDGRQNLRSGASVVERAPTDAGGRARRGSGAASEPASPAAEGGPAAAAAPFALASGATP